MDMLEELRKHLKNTPRDVVLANLKKIEDETDREIRESKESNTGVN